jgi:hypothetical protein
MPTTSVSPSSLITVDRHSRLAALVLALPMDADQFGVTLAQGGLAGQLRERALLPQVNDASSVSSVGARLARERAVGLNL